MIRGCDCTVSHRVNGDGCRYCQPQEHIDRLTDWINEARDEIAALAKERKDLECQLSAAEADKKRLRGQLQHCVQQLNRANRDARDRNEYTDAIDSANRAIYEIFECPVKEQSGN